ncbi:hypothetical protein ACQEVZ_05580 [Dactylosporangium sp. CA-152071]|uniref:hypothetical protein n=1 Tax=Dactylosporangium sp. CA-152071 TaxID=3239933 RepID=UPI003D8BDC61
MADTLVMDVQLDVDASAGEFAELTCRWIDEMSVGIRPQVRAALAGQPAKLAASGEPGTPFSVLGVTRGYRETTRNCSTAGLQWLRTELGKGQPSRADLWCGVHDEHGARRWQSLVLDVTHDADESPGWLALSGNPLVSSFVDPVAGLDEQRLWLAALFTFADRVNPGFGHISLYYDGGNTALERAVPTTMPFAARYREYALNECRRYLRGYSWVTIVPEELLPRVGGVSRLRDSGAFTQVRPLAGGGVWLQATDDYREFDDVALGRVFEAVAPALRPGLPRDLGRPMHGKNPSRVVLRDAAELGAE